MVDANRVHLYCRSVGVFINNLRLIRFQNCLLAMVGVGVGAYLTTGTISHYRSLLAAIAAFFVCAAGNVVNDLVDIKIDRINRPHRVLVQGLLTRRYALGLAIVLHVVAIIVASLVDFKVAAVALVALILLLAYNLHLKRVPFLGNATVAFLAGMTFVSGGIAADPESVLVLPGPLVPALFAFFFHLVREIVKDVDDIDGDRAADIVTLPQILGIRPSLILALGLYSVLTVLTLLPAILDWYGSWYKIITIYVVDLPMLLLLIIVWGNPSRSLLRITSLALKIGMGLGIVALMVADKN